MTGGALSLAVALLVVVSVVGRRFFNAPIPGDFEMVQMATAIAVFASCPTARPGAATSWSTPSPPGCRRASTPCIDAFWDLVYAGMMGLIDGCLAVGTLDHIRNGQTTMVLQFIVWPAIAICTGLGAAADLVALATAAGCCGGSHERPWHRGLGFGAMLVLIALRAPVGLSMLVVGAVGYIHLSSWPALFAYMKINPYYQFANYTLSVIPLFILMGALAEQSGLSSALFRAAEAFAGRLRGGLAMAVIWACTAFGAICGSSVATTATFGRAALPELRRYRYDGGFATGTIAVGGTLGILIPPSVILVVYAISTEQNIAKLFKAALIPGLMAACSTAGHRLGRAPPPGRRAAGAGRASAIGGGAGLVWPVLLIALMVVGGIYGGVFTPTEGAAVGAIAMLLVGLAQRSLDWRGMLDSLKQTAETTAMIFIILLGSEVFNAFLALLADADAGGRVGHAGSACRPTA